MKRIFLVIAFLLIAFPAQSAIAVVQHTNNSHGAGGSTLAITVTSTGSGNLLVVQLLGFQTGGTQVVSGVSDGTNAFTQFPGAALAITTGTFVDCNLDVWYLSSSTSGKTTITITMSISTQFIEAEVWEVSGFTTLATDGVSRSSESTGVLTTDTGQTVTTTGTSGFLAAFVGEANAILTNPKIGNEFSSGGDIRSTDAWCSLISSTAAAHTPEWTSNTSGSKFTTITAAFKENSGPTNTNNSNLISLGVGK